MELITLTTVVLVFFMASFFSPIVGGAALFTIPILIFAGLSPHVAIGTSKIGSVGNTFGGATGFGVEKSIDYKTGFLYMAFVIVGTIVGVFLILSIPELIVEKLVGVLMVGIATCLFFRKTRRKNDSKHKKKMWLVSFTAFVSGIYWGFYGAGLGIINRFIFHYLFGYTMIQSAALSVFSLLGGSIFALVMFSFNGAVQYTLFVPLIVASFLGAYLGARFGVKIGNENIRKLLMLAAVIMGVMLLV